MGSGHRETLTSRHGKRHPRVKVLLGTREQGPEVAAVRVEYDAGAVAVQKRDRREKGDLPGLAPMAAAHSLLVVLLKVLLRVQVLRPLLIERLASSAVPSSPSPLGG